MATRTISKAAADAGVNPDTLRYLRAGRPAGTTGAVGSGYRMYDGSTTDRVGLIKGAQGLGLRLDSIRERLAMHDRGACPCGHTREFAVQHLTEIDAEIIRLTAVWSDLVGLTASLVECPSPPAGLCWCRTVLTQKGGDPNAD